MTIKRDGTLQFHNTSGTTGVSWNTNAQRWVADIQRGNRRVFIGTFKVKKDAIRVRKEAEDHFQKTGEIENVKTYTKRKSIYANSPKNGRLSQNNKR